MQLVFSVEKLTNKRLHSYLNYLKNQTLKRFSELKNASHFIVSSFRNRQVKKMSDAFNFLKVHSNKSFFMKESVNNLKSLIKKNQRK